MDTMELEQYAKEILFLGAAYLGHAKGYETIAEAIEDAAIKEILVGALEEVGWISRKDGERRYKEALEKWNLSQRGLDCLRVGMGQEENLGEFGNLLGAVKRARENGVYAYCLLKIMAYGFLFLNPESEESKRLRNYIVENGIDKAIRKYTNLQECDIIYTLKRHYLKADGQFVAEDMKRVNFLKQAYTNGFFSEKRYKGCGQCTLNGLFETTKIVNKDLFRAATGFSNGMGLCGDGVCGGYSGGIMFMGYLRGRDLDRIPIDGDNENKVFAFACAQELHDHFIACYGSNICMRIHEKMFDGEHFVLREPGRLEVFEGAGAHTVVCTTVVGLATSWVAEILLDKGLYSLA